MKMRILLTLAFAMSTVAANTWVRFAVRRVLEFCRSVPDIVFAMIFVAAFGLGALPGVLAMAIHTSGALGKLLTEVLEISTCGRWRELLRPAAIGSHRCVSR